MNTSITSNLVNVLSVANGRNRQRTISETEARNLVEYAEAKVKELPTQVRPLVSFQYADGVCNSYKYAATSTWLTISFDANGDAIGIKANRTSSPRKAYGARVRRLAIKPEAGKVEGFRSGFMQI